MSKDRVEGADATEYLNRSENNLTELAAITARLERLEQKIESLIEHLYDHAAPK